jgi:hypothetical protein
VSTTRELEEYEKVGTCEHCGESDIVIGKEDERCDECSGRFIHCDICDEEQFDEHPCRHVFRDENFEWQGSGVWVNEALKPTVFKLFDLMPAGFPSDLKVAILSGKFYTFLSAPMIGSGGSLTMNGMPDRDGKFMVLAWGSEMIKVGEGEHAEETADAYHWLASLYQDRTPEANAATITWIDEYLSARAGQEKGRVM